MGLPLKFISLVMARKKILSKNMDLSVYTFIKFLHTVARHTIKERPVNIIKEHYIIQH